MSTSRGAHTMTMLALALLLLPGSARAQDPIEPDTPVVPSTPGVSASATLGAGSMDLAGQLTLSVGVATETEVLLRVTETSEFNLFSPSDLVGDAAVLVGRRGTSGKTWARAAAGLGWVHSVRYGNGYNCSWFFCDYDADEESTLGLALQGDAVWAMARSFGIGISAFGNVNPVRSFAGFTVGFHLGRLR